MGVITQINIKPTFKDLYGSRRRKAIIILNNTCDFLYYLPDFKKLESKEFSVRFSKDFFFT